MPEIILHNSRLSSRLPKKKPTALGGDLPSDSASGAATNCDGAGLLEQLPYGLAGYLQLAVEGCVSLDRIETQASQEVTSFTVDRIKDRLPINHCNVWLHLPYGT